MIFKFSPKILGIRNFDGSFLLIMKENDNYNIYKKFQVHITNVFGLRLGAKPLTLTAYPTSPGQIFSAKMTTKDDPTISCSHLVAEPSVIAGWENP